MNKQDTSSRDVTRVCEKCNQPSLLLTQEVQGKFSFNIVFNIKMGVVAERWSCQNCDHQFQISTESPNPATMWLAFGWMFGLLGAMGFIFGVLHYMGIGENPDNPTTLFDLIMGFLMLFSGMIAGRYGMRKRNILKRNPIAIGITPKPFNVREKNLTLDLQPKLCTCGNSMSCIAENNKSFNLIPLGTVYTFSCDLSGSDQNSSSSSCEREITIESLWRSVVFLLIASMLLLFASIAFEMGLESIVIWIFFLLTLIISLSIIALRTVRIITRFKHPRI